MSKTLKSIIAKAPGTPGVYKFLSEKGEIIYVGKAKNLKKRLSQYMQKGKKHSPKIDKMLEKSTSVEWIEVASEVEALILEDNLIKELNPRYNVLLKDDKTFQYIKVTIQEDYPEVTTVRKIEKDGAKYFGPKTSGTDVKRLLESAKKIFRLCSVKNISLDLKGKPLDGAKVAVKHGKMPAKRPCLDFHIKRCTGPCAGMVTPEEYRKQIDEAIAFLNGDYKAAIEQLKAQMMEYAQNKKFERAAAIRDQIESIERSAQKQLITDTNIVDRDVIAYVPDLGKNFFNLFQIRSGKLVSQENFVSEGEETPEEIMEAFLREYYSLAADIPKEILVSIEVDNKLMKAYIEKHTDHAVQVIHPQAGKKDDLVLLAEQNARSYAKQNRVRWMADEKKPEMAIEELQKKLGLKNPIKRLECFDISHLGGTETVGSMSVFKKGKPSKADYRLFRLKSTVGKIDDFQSMEEVIRRRLNYLPELLPEGYKIRTGKKGDEKALESHWGKEELKDVGIKNYQILEKNKKVVGAASIIELSEKVHEIGSLFVDEDERGQKLGYQLIKKIIDKSKQKRLYLMCEPDLEGYYTQFGFDVLHKAPKELKKQAKKYEKRGYGPHIFLSYQKKKPDTSFTSTPSLIVIDGGKGQLSTAYKVLEEKGRTDIPIISLAKKLEEVFVPKKSDPLNIPADTEASYLLQRARDEAHRFAITFNKESRLKSMTKSQLDEVVGLGPKMKTRLLAHFGSTEAIKEAPLEQLVPICGEPIAKKIKEQII